MFIDLRSLWEQTAAVAGALSANQNDQTLAAAATTAVTGSFVVSESADSLASTASIAVTATFSATQSDQTLSGLASTAPNGSLGITQADNSLSSTASIASTAVLALTAGADTLASTASTAVTASLSASQAANTLIADSTNGSSGPVAATFSVTQADQIIISAASVPRSGQDAGGSTGQGSQRKRPQRRKYVVEIDGQTFAVASLAEAQEVFAEAAQAAEAKASAEVEKSTSTNLKVKALRRVIAHKLAAPSIRVQDSETDAIAAQIQRQADELRSNIAQLYADAVRSAEIGVLLRRQQDDEDDFILNLLI